MDQHKFHVGDCVQVKDWDELVEEFGIDDEGNIPAPGFFNRNMRYMCGMVCHIESMIRGSTRIITEEQIEYHSETRPDDYWALHTSMIKPYAEPEEDSADIQVQDYEKVLESCWMRE